MYDYEKGAAVKIMTKKKPSQMTWEALLTEVDWIFGDLYESGENDVHGAYYGGIKAADENVQAPEPEAEAPEDQEEPETAESQNAEASVATSQREEPEEDEADEKLGAIWCQIEDLEEDIANFVGYYNADDAANGDIQLDALKKAYKNTIDMAAGMERLIMALKRKGRADE